MTPQPASVSATHPYSTIVLLALAAFASAGSLRVTDAMLPKIASDFQVDLGVAAGTVTAFSIAYGLLQAIYGPVGDRYGKIRVIALACFASTASSIVCGLAPSAAWLMFARALAGATAAAVIPLSMAWIGDVVPYAQRQPVLARFLTGQILGLATGQAVGGIAAEHFDWRAPFFALAAWAFAVGVLLMRAGRGTQLHAKPLQSREAPWREIGTVLAVPWARVVLATAFVEGALLYGPFAFFATHLHVRFGLPLSSAGLVVMFYALGGLVFSFNAARFVERLGEPGMALCGGLLLSISMLAVGASPVWWTAVPGAAIAGLGFYMWHNTLQTNATQMAPARRGAAVSLFASAFFLGQSMGVGLGGAFVGRVGTGAIITTGACLLPFVAATFAVLRHRRSMASAAA